MAQKHTSQLSRRQFLKYSVAGSMLAMSGLAGSAVQAEGSSPVTSAASRVILHSYDREATLPSQAVREVMLNATDMSWLKPGDSVFVKVASNSNLPAPSVT